MPVPKVLMIDLGGTLITNSNSPQLIPGVKPALTALRQLPTPSGQPLVLCLVSDFKMPTAPATPTTIEPLFKEYLAILNAPAIKLKQSFEPVNQCITLSTHVGVNKPDCRVFQMALLRLGATAQFSECVLITEDAGHIAAAKAMGLQTMRFGPVGAAGIDFHDWSQAPAMIAQKIAHP